MLRTLSFSKDRLQYHLHVTCRDVDNSSILRAATKYNFGGLPDSASYFAHTAPHDSLGTAVTDVDREVNTPTVARRTCRAATQVIHLFVHEHSLVN